jgi:hypothetical protein
MKAPLFALLLAMPAGSACIDQPGPAAAVSDASKPSSLDNSAAASQVAAVRCDHESSCGNVGPGRRYASPDACLAELSQSAERDLAPSVCPSGIDSQRLRTCATQFQRESCEPLAPLNRMYTCDPAVLCSRRGGVTVSAEDVYGI